MKKGEPNFKCPVCGKEVHLTPSKLKNAKCCSRQCQIKSGAKAGENSSRWKGGSKVKCICKYCGKEFYIKPSEAKKGKGIYCSRKCFSEARRHQFQKRIIRYCIVCGKEFYITPSKEKSGRGKYCSRECMAKDYSTRKGENNSRWKGGKVELTCINCGKKYYRWPGDVDESHFCSMKCMAIYKSINCKAENSQFWRGGKIELVCKNCGKKYYRWPSSIENSCFCSVSCMAFWRTKNKMFITTNKNYKSGKRDDLGGLFVRSRWEANYARYLNWLITMGEIKSWEYEADEFMFPVKRGNVRYLPDFKITNNDGSIEYHEVKGYMDDDSRVKLKRMEKYYPDIKLVLIDSDAYKSIEKTMSRILEDWEGRRS